MRAFAPTLLVMALQVSAGSASADNATASSSVSISSSQSGNSSEASFTGNDGRHTVNGDVIEIRQGQLTVNGVPHGAVKPSSVIRYIVRGDKKDLIVDGQARPLHK